MLLFYLKRSWPFIGMLLGIFLSCGGSHEYRIETLWKFLATDESQRVTMYYSVANNELQLRFENKTEQQLNVEISLRIFDSSYKGNLYITPLKKFNLHGKTETIDYQIFTIGMSNITIVRSVDVITFVVSENSTQIQ